MAIPESVLCLIREEQKRQGGLFVPNEQAYLEKLDRCAELLVHQEGGYILGFAFFYCNAPDKKTSYITLIGTSEHGRGKGIGYGLLQYILLLSKRRGFFSCQLEVRKDNVSAFGFYKKIGFTIEEDRGEKYLMSIAIE